MTSKSLLCLLFLLLPLRAAFSQVGWEVIVDDSDPTGYSETGNAWETWQSAEAYKGSYRYLSHKGQNIPRRGTATWQATLPHTGEYEVSVHFRSTVNRTTDADYEVHDGSGKKHYFTLNQQTLPTGWHTLGRFIWTGGQVGKIVLDGTDDNQSDEADAVRWRFVRATQLTPPTPCPAQAPGSYTIQRYARRATATGDWSSPDAAQGAPDGRLASSPNVDAGEILRGTDFDFCTPAEPHQITAIRVGTLARVQYDSGQYHLVLYLASEGRRTTFSHTTLRWTHLDITATRPLWRFQDLRDLVLEVGLHAHPGGRRDSDAWVDAFQLEVTYQLNAAPPTCDPPKLLCDARCIDPLTEPQHCGACNTPCAPSQNCQQGRCIDPPTEATTPEPTQEIITSPEANPTPEVTEESFTDAADELEPPRPIPPLPPDEAFQEERPKEISAPPESTAEPRSPHHRPTGTGCFCDASSPSPFSAFFLVFFLFFLRRQRRFL